MCGITFVKLNSILIFDKTFIKLKLATFDNLRKFINNRRKRISDKERDGAKSENQNSPIRLSPRSHHPSSCASICRQNLITWQIFLIILGTSWSSLAPLDHPWLFLNSKKVFEEILIHFRKSNDTQIETWITKTANIDSSLNTARKAEKSRKNLYSCYSKWADRHESSRVLRYFRLEIRLGIFVGNY